MNSTTWIEVDNSCFETKRGHVYETTLLLNRCTQLKRSVRRERDAVTLEGDSRDEVDTKVAAYVERPGVKLLIPEQTP